jgi:hypothetical protein
MSRTRRAFLSDVGTGMLTAAVGPALVADLGLGSALADEAPARLTFGKLEPLVALLQETAPAKLQPILIDRLNKGLDLNQLTAAAALANARTFGGEDYVGFHTLMALSPALSMSRELPVDRRALPVLKVLYRNSNRITEKGGRKAEVLRPVKATTLPAGRVGGEVLRDATRARDMNRAEAAFAACSAGRADDAFDHLLYAVEDGTEVHRVVLAYRAYDMVSLIGRENAHTMLRQSVRYCVKNEVWAAKHRGGEARTLLPKLLDKHRLLGRAAGKRPAEDVWVERLSQAFFKSTPAAAAEAAASALAEGFLPDAIGEAISLAANQLVLRDAGRPERQTSPGKPVGSIHGDSIGVHASDSANAWRNIARVSNQRNKLASLILGAYQVALDRAERGGDFLTWQPWPRAEHVARLTAKDGPALLREAEDAIRAKDQARACAAVHRLGAMGHDAGPVFALMLRYAISEDGALHAEKYYRTVRDEFATTRAAFRWRQLVALARVTASEYGQPAPGQTEACKLLKV